MIVEPDFFDHWKTQMLIGLTQDKASPLLVLRLWGHCQQRKAWEFPEMSNEALKAVCRWEGESSRLREVLTECGFLEKECTYIRVHEWEAVNYILVRNWENGKYGGRRANPRETQNESGLSHQKPTANPRETQTPKNDNVGQAIDKIEKSEKIDKKRVSKRSPGTFVPPTVEECRAEAENHGMPASEGDNFFAHHEAAGWMLKPRLSMSNWRAAMVTWRTRFVKFGGVLRAAAPPAMANRIISERWLQTRATRETPCIEMARTLVRDHTPEQIADICTYGKEKFSAWWSDFDPFLRQAQQENQQ